MPDPVVLHASEKHASALAFSPDGKRLVAGGMGGTLRVWNVGTWKPWGEWPGHTKSANDVSFSADSGHALTSGSDSRVFLRETEHGDIISTFEKHEGGWFAPDGRILLKRVRGEKYTLHDSDGAGPLLEWRSGIKRAGAPVFLADGTAAIGGVGSAVELWDWAKGKKVGELPGHGTSVVGLAALPDGRRVLTGDYEGTLRVWDVAKRSVVQEWDAEAPGYLFAAADPRGRCVASSGDHRIDLWSLEGEGLATLPMPVKGVYSLEFSPDGEWLANAAADGKARVWRVKEEL